MLAFSGQTHQYKDDNPTNTSSDVYTVTVTVTDNDGGSGSGTTSVTVNNVAPVATITGPASASVYAVGTPVTFTGTFTDQGTQDTHNMTCTTAWACTYWQLDTIKKAATVTETNGSGTASTTYTFTTPGVYNITLYVRDDDGGVGSANTVNGFNAMVVIYDPNAGFVTGGGYVTHQASWTTPPIAHGRQGQLRLRRQVQEGRLDARRRDRVPVQGLQHQLPLDLARLADRHQHHHRPERRRPEGVVPGFGHDQWHRRLPVPGHVHRQGQHRLLPDQDLEQDHRRGHLRQHARCA